MKSDVVVDTKGLACPMPIVKAKKAIGTIEAGQVMEVHATDKGAVNDFSAWVKQTGNELLFVEEVQGVYIFYVRKA